MEQFVDNYLTCSTDNEETVNLVELQTHKHSRTCRKKENQYVDLDFQYLSFQEPCYYIHLKRKFKSTEQNTHCYRKE